MRFGKSSLVGEKFRVRTLEKLGFLLKPGRTCKFSLLGRRGEAIMATLKASRLTKLQDWNQKHQVRFGRLDLMQVWLSTPKV